MAADRRQRDGKPADPDAWRRLTPAEVEAGRRGLVRARRELSRARARTVTQTPAPPEPTQGQ